MLEIDILVGIGLLIGGTIFPLLLGWVFWPKLTKALLSDLRVPRILHFVALGGLGMAIALHGQGNLEGVDWEQLAVSLCMLIVALTYAAVFAIVTNNLEDLEADRISNPDRPLVQRSVERESYLMSGIVCLVWSLGIAVVHDFGYFNDFMDPQQFIDHFPLTRGILFISAGYYIYSCRPFRLKRIPILAKLIIGFNSWAVAVCGYGLAGGDWTDFPWIWSVFILVPLSLAANFIDLKDVEGDRATGVATLPVLMGEVWARHVIAAATLATYVMGGVLLGIWWAYPMNALAAGVHVYLLYRKPYDERWIFLVYVGAVLGLDIFLVWA